MLEQNAERPALELPGGTWSYRALTERAAAIAQCLPAVEGGPLAVIGLLAHRSLSAYAGVVAAHLAGLGYMPLHPRFPVERLANMLAQSETGLLIAGVEGLETLDALLPIAGRTMTVVCPETNDVNPLAMRHPQHCFVPVRVLDAGPTARPRPVTRGQTAYLLFTSGSTGVPKGVPVSFGNLSSYVDYMTRRLDMRPSDRASQTFDLTFDLSAHDLFVTWAAGACLCPLSDATLLAPAKFVRDRALTVWFSVPSVAMLMARTRILRAGVFPSLRLSLFCGEALPVATAETWAAAAPESTLINLYGPTEATIAIADYPWTTASAAEARCGLVPLGRIFPTQRHALLDRQRRVLEGPGRGELCLAGSQVTQGYLNDRARTAEQYVRLSGQGDAVWYRTGDLVERDVRGTLHFLGRIDDQIKYRGHRIELQDIDHALRKASGSDLAVTVPFPSNRDVQELVACIADSSVGEAELLQACRRLIPDYMVPTRVVFLVELPRNANGKIDRVAITRLVGAQ